MLLSKIIIRKNRLLIFATSVREKNYKTNVLDNRSQILYKLNALYTMITMIGFKCNFSDFHVHNPFLGKKKILITGLTDLIVKSGRESRLNPV